MRKVLSTMLVAVMVFTVFSIPFTGEVSATTGVKADPSKNTIIFPDTVKVNSVNKLIMRGDRDTVIATSVDDTKFYPYSYEYMDRGKNDTKIKLNYNRLGWSGFAEPWCNRDQDEIATANVKFLAPGKKTIKVVYYEYKIKVTEGFWNGQPIGGLQATIWSTDSVEFDTYKTVQVQGKAKFKVTKGGKFKSGQIKSKWLNQNAKVGNLPKVKAKKGYKFKGWYTKKTGGKKIKASTKVNFAKNPTKTYYAQFKKIK